MHLVLSRRGALVVLAGALTLGSALQRARAQGKPTGPTQTLSGAAAQNSPQADLFLAYEDALLDGGLEAAGKHMTQAKRDEFKQMIDAFGMDGFKRMQDEKRRTRLSPAERRKRIQKVEISGDYAYLEATTERKGVLDIAGFLKTAEGWKVTPVRR